METQTAPDADGQDSGTIRVLHVDDDPSFVEVAAELLERQDDRIEVETEVRADDGLECVEAGAIDCVVSDYDMPHTDGLEFLEQVREDYPDLPFILFTGKGSEEIASEAISAGVTDYLQKRPGTDQYTVLANRIENAVEQFHTQRRYRTLVENFPDGGVGLYDRSMRYVLVAGTAFSEHGIDNDDWEGRRLEEVHTDEYVEAYLPNYRAALDGKHSTFEFEFESRTYRGNSVPVRDGDGEVVGGLTMTRDVTAQDRTERALRRQREAVLSVEEILVEEASPAFETVAAELDSLQDASGDQADGVPPAADRLADALDRAIETTRNVARDGDGPQ